MATDSNRLATKPVNIGEQSCFMTDPERPRLPNEVPKRYYLLLVPLALFFGLSLISDSGGLLFPDRIPDWLHDMRHQDWAIYAFFGYSFFLFAIHTNPELGYRSGLLYRPGGMDAPVTMKQGVLLPFILKNAVWILILLAAWLLRGKFPIILLPAGFLLAVFGPIYWYTSALNRGDYDTGLRRLALVERFGLQPGASLIRGLALAQAGRFDEARTFCEKGLVVINSPGQRRVLLDGLGLAFRGFGNLEKAQGLLEQSDVLPLPRPFPGTSAKLALVMLERKVTPDKALVYAEKALAAQECLGLMGRVVYFIDRAEPAKRHLLRGWALSLLGRKNEVDVEIALALPAMNPRIKSDYADLCYLMARVLLAQDKPQEAIDYLHKAVDVDPAGSAGIIAKRLLSQMR